MSPGIGLLSSEPTRIDAINVSLVLANKSDIFSFNVPVPDTFGPFPLPSGSSAAAVVQDITVQIIKLIPLSSSGSTLSILQETPQAQLAVILISVTAEITIFNHYGVVIATYTTTTSRTTTVVIASNPITQVTSFSLLSTTLINEVQPYVLLEIFICLTVTEKACLLIPTLGFCTPKPCSIPECITFPPSCQP